MMKKETSRGKKVLTRVSAVLLATTLLMSAVPTATAAAKNPYASYTRLDMTNFKKTVATYSPDALITSLFEDRVYDGSTVPRDRMGSCVVDVGSPALLYAEGEVSMAELRRVLLHGKKYIGGGKYKYIVTGIYENSGLTYNCKSANDNPNAAIKTIYAKGFKSNPYSKTVSYSDGYLCTKIKDGGSSAKIGYVRAIVFTLKRIA